MARLNPTEFVKFEDLVGRYLPPFARITQDKKLILSVGFLREAYSQLVSNRYVIFDYLESVNYVTMQHTNDSFVKGAIKITLRKYAGSSLIFGAACSLSSFLVTHKDNINLDKMWSRKFKMEAVVVPKIGMIWGIDLNKEE